MNRHTLLALLAATALSGCAAATPATRPVDMTFSQMKPIALNVGAVQVINNTQPVKNPRVMPAVALQNYARHRLDAVGGEGTLNFVIQQASLTEGQAETTGDWTEAFQLQRPIEYTLTMRVGLDLVGRTTQPNMTSAFTIERKKVLPAGSSLADRDSALNHLVEAMVYDMDKSVATGLSTSMKIVVAPGAITFGTPAPLEATGAMVVQPGPASAKPVTITGTLD